MQKREGVDDVAVVRRQRSGAEDGGRWKLKADVRERIEELAVILQRVDVDGDVLLLCAAWWDERA